MYTLIKPVVEWIFKKCLVLAGILAVLVIGYWIKNEWKTVRATLDHLIELDGGLKKEHDHLASLHQKLSDAIERGNAALREYQSLDSVASAAEAEYKRLKDATPWYHITLLSSKAQARDAAKALADTARAAAAAFRSNHPDTERLGLQDQVKDAEARVLTLETEKTRVADADRPLMQRLIVWTRQSLPTAGSILAGVIIIPWILKVLLYFWLAPCADRLPPVRISDIHPSTPPAIVVSAVSHEIEVQPDQELLTRPEFLQSSTKPSQKCTRLFLNARLPFSSALSGMLLLTSIRAEGDKATRVVVSPTKNEDCLSELGLLSLPQGGRMVIHPRGLAGVVKPRDAQVSISSKWCLRNLHGWLTLQLRYLEFSGPCTLILKGCRGVKAETPDTSAPRLLNQSATLGFSSHLAYSNTRCETFMSYFMGKEDLFNDQFAGENGVFVYEEMPDLRRKAGLTGRGLEGVFDGILKVFGI